MKATAAAQQQQQQAPQTMPNNAAAASAELERIWVAADGSIKALYGDNSLLLLSSNGMSFTRVPASGAKTVQLTDCCLSRWKPLLAELLAFRNQHLDLPCFPAWLQKQLQVRHGLLFSTGFPVTDTTWSRTADQAVEDGLVKLLDDTTIQLLSSCGSAHITLQHTGLRFAVSYPLLLDYDAGSNTYSYTQHTQVFSRSQYPARWRAALAVATAAAQLAAVSSVQHTQEQQQQQHMPRAQQDLLRLQQQLQEPHRLLLLDVTNRPALGSDAAGSLPVWQDHNVAGSRADAVATAGTSGSSPRRCGSPVKRQHNPWQAADQLLSCRRQPRPQPAQPTPSSPATGMPSLQLWRPPGSPGSPSAALYAVAERQQQQQQQLGWPAQSEAGRSCSSSGVGSDCVVQLPLMPEVLRALPQQLQQQQQQPRREHMPHAPSAGQLSSSNSSGDRHSNLAAALAEALGQWQQGGASGADSSCVGSWWLEPHLLLPSDELLHMVWTPDATLIFAEGMNEVEVWLHSDQSCLFSFQRGAFVTHLQPHATAAARAGGGGSSGAGAPGAAAAAAVLSVEPGEGLLDGCVDAREVSRVYAASTLPPDLAVPVLLADGTRCGDAVVPLGRIATEALRFRSTMERVKAGLPAPTTSTAATTHSSSSTGGRQLQAACGRRLLAAQRIPAQPSRGQQQQQHLSLDVKEDQEVPGVGHFTAYADGRVRVVFADRTILSLNADRAQARLILPDGSRQEVPASRPLGVEEYVQAALEFATWSSHTPVQRAAALRMQALVAAELRSSARMAAICEWGSNPGQLPHAVGSCPTDGSSSSLLLEAGPGQQQPLMIAAQPAKGDGDGCCWALPDVEGLLQANRALLDRL